MKYLTSFRDRGRNSRRADRIVGVVFNIFHLSKSISFSFSLKWNPSNQTQLFANDNLPEVVGSDLFLPHWMDFSHYSSSWVAQLRPSLIREMFNWVIQLLISDYFIRIVVPFMNIIFIFKKYWYKLTVKMDEILTRNKLKWLVGKVNLVRESTKTDTLQSVPHLSIEI